MGKVWERFLALGTMGMWDYFTWYDYYNVVNMAVTKILL